MKLFTLALALLLISTANFAQSETCPGFFRRNNGNGTCADGQLRLYFNTCPPIAPIIDSVYTNGTKAAVVFSLPDMSKCSSQGYIGYCVIGSNMPPAALWTIYFHNTGATNTFGCLVPEGAPLPVVLNTFLAKRSGNNVVLTWKTSFELNGQAFEIQQKSGNDFVTIGSLPATNFINGSSYSFTAKNTLKAVSEYRLRMLSKDAAATFSETRSVKGTGSSVDFTIFPNPALRSAQVSITDISEPTDVQVIDNTGRLVRSISIRTSNTIPLNDLQPGLYRVRLINKSSGEAVTKNLTIIQ